MGGSVTGQTGIQGSTGVSGSATGIQGWTGVQAWPDSTYWRWTFTKPVGYTMSCFTVTDGTASAAAVAKTVPPNAI